MTSPSLSEERGFSFIAIVMLLFLFIASGTILFLLVLPTRATAALKVTDEKARLLRVALGNYKLNHGGASLGLYPTSITFLATTDGTNCVLDNTPTDLTYLTLQGWCGPYVDIVFTNIPNDYYTDGWGTLFTFNNLTGVLTSCGPDRTCGTSDDITYSN